MIIATLAYLGGRAIYFKPKFRNGENTPGISGTLLNGNKFSLEELKGNFVLIDFWGSWCGPCRKENPELVKLYRQYKETTFKNNARFEIVSVAIETDEGQWKRAIGKDQLDWAYHIVQLDRFNSPIAKVFGVREIPTKYLLNDKGKIISVNPSIKEIDRILAERI